MRPATGKSVRDEPTHQYNTRASKKKRLENLVVENPENKLQTTPSSGRKKSCDKVNKKTQTKSTSQSQWETQETTAADDEQRSPDDPDSDWKDRLKSLHRRRDVGLWIQCSRQDCHKWRFVEEIHDPVDVPEIWYCDMNPDKSIARCDYPAEKVPCEDVEDAIENKYNAGSIVWARLDGYPWWPAMVDDNPYTLSYYKLRKGTIVPNQYNVIWFDEGPVMCNWIPERYLRPYKPNPQNVFLKKKRMLYRGISYKDRVLQCCVPADEALKLPLYQRLEKFSFVARYGDEYDYPRRYNIEHNKTQPFRGRATSRMGSSIETTNQGTQNPSTSGVAIESINRFPCQRQDPSSDESGHPPPVQPPQIHFPRRNWAPLEIARGRATSRMGSSIETTNQGTQNPSTSGVAIGSINRFPCQRQDPSSDESGHPPPVQPPQIHFPRRNWAPLEIARGRATSRMGSSIETTNQGTQNPSTSGVAIGSINRFPCQRQDPSSDESGHPPPVQPPQIHFPRRNWVPLEIARGRATSRTGSSIEPTNQGTQNPSTSGVAIGSINRFPCQRQDPSSDESGHPPPVQPPQIHFPRRNWAPLEIARGRATSRTGSSIETTNQGTQNPSTSGVAIGSINRFPCQRQDPSSDESGHPPPVQPPQIHFPRRNWAPLEIARGRATSRMGSSIETTNQGTQNPSTSGVAIGSINRFRCQRQDPSSDESGHPPPVQPPQIHFPRRNWAPLEIARGRATSRMGSSIETTNQGTQNPSTSGVAIGSINRFPCQRQDPSSDESGHPPPVQPPQIHFPRRNWVPLEIARGRATSRTGSSIEPTNQGTQNPSTSGVAIGSINRFPCQRQDPSSDESGHPPPVQPPQIHFPRRNWAPLEIARGRATSRTGSSIETTNQGTQNPSTSGVAIGSINRFPCQRQDPSSDESGHPPPVQPPQIHFPRVNWAPLEIARGRATSRMGSSIETTNQGTQNPSTSGVAIGSINRFRCQRQDPSSDESGHPPPVQPPQIHFPRRNWVPLEIARGRATSRTGSSIETTNQGTQNPSTSGVAIGSINRFPCQRQDPSSNESESLHYPHRNWAPLEIENRYDFPDFDPELKKMSLLEHIEFLLNGQIKKIA